VPSNGKSQVERRAGEVGGNWCTGFNTKSEGGLETPREKQRNERALGGRGLWMLLICT